MQHVSKYLLILFFLCNALYVFAQVDTTRNSGKKDLAAHKNIITSFFQQQAQVRYIYSTVINANATAVAWNADGPEGSQVIYFSSFLNTDSARRISAVLSIKEWCNETEPQWSPDGSEIAFLSNARSHGQVQLFIANATTGALLNIQPLTKFEGYVSHLKWWPDGKFKCIVC